MNLSPLPLLAQLNTFRAQAQGLQANAPDRDGGRRIVGRPTHKPVAGQLEAGHSLLDPLDERRLRIGGPDAQDILVGGHPTEADRALVGGRLGIDLRLDGRIPVLGQIQQGDHGDRSGRQAGLRSHDIGAHRLGAAPHGPLRSQAPHPAALLHHTGVVPGDGA